MLKIAIIVGSTRPGRSAEAVARWVRELARKRTDAEFELVHEVGHKQLVNVASERRKLLRECGLHETLGQPSKR